MGVGIELDPDNVVENVKNQAEGLADTCDHVTRLIAHLNIPTECFSGYTNSNLAGEELEPMIKVLIYMRINEYSQGEVQRRMQAEPSVYLLFGLDQPPLQQTISYTRRNRLTAAERHLIGEVVDVIREVCVANDIAFEGEPRIHPADADNAEISDEIAIEAVARARDFGLNAFDSKRADNIKYDDEIFFERQAFLTLNPKGTTTRTVTDTDRFQRASAYEETPSGDTHLGTMKKVATPADQVPTHGEAHKTSEDLHWEEIWEELREPFHEGVSAIIDHLKETGAIEEPVTAAIDITPWIFTPSPYKDEDDVAEDEEPLLVNGKERYPKEDFPEMVHGLKDGDRGYEFATITIIGEDTPIVIGIRPVRRHSQWERTDPGDTSNRRIVQALIEQAEQHVEVGEVFLDREFDADGVRDAIDRRGITYLIPARTYAPPEEAQEFPSFVQDPDSDAGILPDVPREYNGRYHQTTSIFVESSEEEGSYAHFTTNRSLSPLGSQ